MHASERTEFCRALSVLGDAFNRALSPVTFESYWRGLEDLPLRDVATSILLAMREEEFFPTIAALRRRCTGTAPLAVRAEAAWTAALRAVGRSWPDDADPIARRVSALMGGLGNTPTEDHDRIGRSRVKQRFLELYEAVASRDEEEAARSAIECGTSKLITTGRGSK